MSEYLVSHLPKDLESIVFDILNALHEDRPSHPDFEDSTEWDAIPATSATQFFALQFLRLEKRKQGNILNIVNTAISSLAHSKNENTLIILSSPEGETIAIRRYTRRKPLLVAIILFDTETRQIRL